MISLKIYFIFDKFRNLRILRRLITVWEKFFNLFFYLNESDKFSIMKKNYELK